jgi:hypothetical protein
MKKHFISAALLALGLFSLTPVWADNIPKISENVRLPNIIKSESNFSPIGYFTFRVDPRKCASPLCGGVFVKAVNQKLTRCANGIWRRECYVATVNDPQNLDRSTATLIQGRIKAKTYKGFGNLGAFELKAAFSPATANKGIGYFVGLENNGIVCITSPCFSYDQYLLNRAKIRAISGLDLAASGASQEVLDKALAITANGGVLIAMGVNKQVDEFAGKGITFVAEQIYLPIEP